MRRFRVLLAPATALLLSGCGYVHFGRLPEAARPLGDAKAAEAYANLSTENKILKQELALARREGEALRVALERAGASAAAANLAISAGTPAAAPSQDLVARLNETSTELASLRASYAKLQAERDAATTTNNTAPDSARLRDLEDKLAASLREHTQLQSENNRLRTEIDSARRDNVTLAQRLDAATRQYDQAQASVAQLNTELVAQKQARARAEQATEALRAQLSTVVAQASIGAGSLLQSAKEPPAAASATAELRLNTARLRPPPAPAATSPAPADTSRKHTVVAGDTLEKISQRYYGAPDRWATIYNANAEQLKEGLRPGVVLTIPN